MVIRLEEIKIEKEKIKRVLDWPIPKEVKNIQKFWDSSTTISSLSKILQQ